MRKRKSIFLNFINTLFLVALFPLSVFAQQMQAQPRSAEDMATAQTERMQKQFKLSAEQFPKVKAINIKYAHKMEEIMKSDKERETKMLEMKKLPPVKEAEMKKVLTAEQFKQYQEMEERRRQMMQNRMQNQAAPPAGNMPPPPPAK